MKYADACVVCGARRLAVYPARIAPFLLDRIWCNKIKAQAKLIQCRDCDFIFYNPRLDQDELSSLYDGYRGPEYQQLREKYEPWYTRKINESIGGPLEQRLRKRNLLGVLEKYIDTSSVKSVLDFGGDRGQFIPDEFSGAEKYIYERSGVNPLGGGR